MEHHSKKSQLVGGRPVGHHTPYRMLPILIVTGQIPPLESKAC